MTCRAYLFHHESLANLIGTMKYEEHKEFVQLIVDNILTCKWENHIGRNHHLRGVEEGNVWTKQVRNVSMASLYVVGW